MSLGLTMLFFAVILIYKINKIIHTQKHIYKHICMYIYIHKYKYSYKYLYTLIKPIE